MSASPQLVQEVRQIADSFSEADKAAWRQLEHLPGKDPQARAEILASLRGRFRSHPVLLQNIDVYDPNSEYGKRFKEVMTAQREGNMREFSRLGKEFERFIAENYPYLAAWEVLSKESTTEILRSIER